MASSSQAFAAVDQAVVVALTASYTAQDGVRNTTAIAAGNALEQLKKDLPCPPAFILEAELDARIQQTGETLAGLIGVADTTFNEDYGVEETKFVDGVNVRLDSKAVRAVAMDQPSRAMLNAMKYERKYVMGETGPSSMHSKR